MNTRGQAPAANALRHLAGLLAQLNTRQSPAKNRPSSNIQEIRYEPNRDTIASAATGLMAFDILTAGKDLTPGDPVLPPGATLAWIPDPDGRYHVHGIQDTDGIQRAIDSNSMNKTIASALDRDRATATSTCLGCRH